MIPIQEELEDPIFMETAILLGYRKQDLQPFNYERLVEQSLPTLKGKSQKQQNFYLKKKAEAFENRRQKILKQITLQVKRKSYSSSKKKNSFNPIVSNLLKEHQILCEKKLKYIEKIKLKKKDDQFNKVNNTIDLGRTTPSFAMCSNSRISKKSVHSSSSQRSGISRKSQTSEHKNRLNMVRQRDKQIESYKKQQFLERQKNSQKKFERVDHERTSISRKLKTRSQISSQAARQKRREMKFIENKQIRDHIQKLHYKVIKHEYLKQKQQQKRKNTIQTPFDQKNRRRMLEIMHETEKEGKRNLYQNKMKTSEKNKQKAQLEKYHELSFKQQQRYMKQKYAQKHKEYAAKEEQDKKRRSIFYEMKSMEDAEYKRREFQEDKKKKVMESRIKEQINQKNRASLEIRKKIQNQNLLKKSENKMQEITEVEKLKRKLIKQRAQYTSQNLRYGKGHSFSYHY